MRKLVKNVGIVLIPFMLGVIFVVCSGFGFNKQLFDLTYQFDYAYVSLPDGEHVEGKVDSWTDYEDGDQLQVKIDGVTYLTHASNVVLVAH